MGTFQIGRVGLENTTGEVHGWASGGDGIKVAGHTQYGSVAEALIVRDQLLGYVEQADEDFVPVLWSEQPEVNGFYRVRSADVDASPDKAPFGVFDWSLQLERVQGYAAPLIESNVLGRTRPGYGSSIPAVCLPGGTKSVDWLFDNGARIPIAPSFTRAGDDGEALVFDFASLSKSTISYYVAPDRFYEGAATIRMGDQQRIVTGRQAPNDVDFWSISNGLIEVRPRQGGPADRLDLEFRFWRLSTKQWSEWEYASFVFPFMVGGLVNIPRAHSITVLRNSPEAVTVRLLSAPNRTPVAIDLTLRRGARYIAGVFGQIMGVLPGIQFSQLNPPTAAGTAGWYRTHDGYTTFAGSPKETNASGGRLSPQTIDSSNDQWPFCFGITDSQIHGSYTDNSGRALNEYMWACSEKQAVVAQ